MEQLVPNGQRAPKKIRWMERSLAPLTHWLHPSPNRIWSELMLRKVVKIEPNRYDIRRVNWSQT
jgi:hypothetical protein